MRLHSVPRTIVAVTVVACAVFAGTGVSRAHDPVDSSLEVVARFLELEPDQVEATSRLLRERREATAPIKREIQTLENRLEELIRRGDDPAAIGAVVLALHDRRAALREIHSEFRMSFEALLSEDQQRRLARMRDAKRLQPLLPAFEQLGLV